MIWLARTVYQDPTRNPKELLTADWSNSRNGIEEHLLDHLIPAAYADAQGVHPARSAAEIDRTRQWISLLARHMRAQRTYDLAWWKINEIRPVPTAQSASVIYVILAAVATIASASWTDEPWSSVEETPWLASMVVGSGVGVFISFARLLFSDRHLPRRFTLRNLWMPFLGVGLPLWLFGSLAESPADGLAAALPAGIITALTSSAKVTTSAASPLASLSMDRTAALISGATVGATEIFFLSFGTELTEPKLWLAGLASALAPILLSAWGQLTLAIAVLGTLRRLPFRLVRGLREARDRGILRRVGSVYQFRHGLLRHRLSDSIKGSGAAGPTLSPPTYGRSLS